MLIGGVALVVAAAWMAVQALLWNAGGPSEDEYLEGSRKSYEEFGKLLVGFAFVVGFPLLVGGLIESASTALGWLVFGLTAMLGFWCCRRLVSRHPGLQLDVEVWAAQAHVETGGSRRPLVILGLALTLGSAALIVALI